jgi:hypothetical protein
VYWLLSPDLWFAVSPAQELSRRGREASDSMFAAHAQAAHDILAERNARNQASAACA